MSAQPAQQARPTLLVVVASIRPVRVGGPVADWFVEKAKEHGGFDVDVADLRELDLPLSTEPNHPMTGNYTFDYTKAWSERVRKADAVVFVFPEYNHSYSAPLKNAIDYLNKEWHYKPAGLVSYGGVSAGLRSAQALKPVLQALRVTVISEAVMIPMVGTLLDEERRFHPTDIVAASAGQVLDELAKLTPILLPLQHK